MKATSLKRDESPGEVPIKLGKGTQKGSQANNSATKR
jgi:hypothetical protein